ncbi:MAG: hypothetical protein ACR2OJ_15670 [Hyphomicrobiales bacterium]
MRFLGMLLVLITPISIQVSAEEVRCTEAVEREAIVSFAPTRTVNPSSDTRNRICRFAVDGWTAGSPPRGALLKALEFLRAEVNQEIYQKSSDEVEALSEAAAVLLAAASPFEVADEKLLSDEGRKAMSACITSVEFVEKEPLRPLLGRIEGFSCILVNPLLNSEVVGALNGVLEEVGSGLVVTELTGPYLIFRNVRGDIHEYLFLSLTRE